MKNRSHKVLTATVIDALAAQDFECIKALALTPITAETRLKATSRIVPLVIKMLHFCGQTNFDYKHTQAQRKCLYYLSGIIGPHSVLFGLTPHPIINDLVLVRALLKANAGFHPLTVAMNVEHAITAGQKEIADEMTSWVLKNHPESAGILLTGIINKVFLSSNW